jgi:hypothetical protein
VHRKQTSLTTGVGAGVGGFVLPGGAGGTGVGDGVYKYTTINNQ